ncbi:MAG: DciA family protein [Hyphomicrobiaceae bacterium]|nr:DciA family protein [Hyphomicrobiaceae bacterium]
MRPHSGKALLTPRVARFASGSEPPRSVVAARRPIAAKTVGSFVPRLTRPAFERYGFSAATLITDWATIVGADIARWTSPERLKWPRRVELGDETADVDRGRPGATLFVAVDPARALDIQYKGRQIVERINAYFGYRAVFDLKIVQAPDLSQRRAVPAAEPAVPARAAQSLAEVSAVTDEGLRAALERMAAGLGARKVRVSAGA